MENQFCPKCGQQSSGEAVFCVKCGNNLVAAQQENGVAASSLCTPTAATQPTLERHSSQPQYTTVREMNYPKAGFGSRSLAYLVDALIGGVPMVPGFIFLGMNMDIIGWMLLCIAGCWAFFYSFCKDGFAGGQSYGKKMNGLMVVSLNSNQPCTMGKSALRALSWYIPYVALVEIVMVLATDKGQRLGDKFASTQVIEVSQYKS